MWAAAIPAAISAAGSIAGGVLAGNQNKETKIQRTQRKLIDQLIGSLYGRGPFADLFKSDPEAFNKSFVEPAQAMFRNQIAPQIQQQYIASGQQRGSGLDDQLLRAGVDLDSMLNQHYMDYIQNAQNRQQNVIGQILGAGSGAQPNQSSGNKLGNAVGGYLSSDAFGGAVKDVYGAYNKSTAPPVSPNSATPRKGFLPDYNIGDPRWGGQY